MTTTQQWQPAWWKDEHTSGWDRVKAAFERDWEQTKSDFHVGGHDLNQNVADTVKQAVGNEAPVKEGAPLQKRPFNATAARYGYGARQNLKRDWNDDIEISLKNDWENAKDRVEGSWLEVRADVRRAFDKKLD